MTAALLALAAALAWGQAPEDDLLAELRARRIVPADSRSWRDEDAAFLARVRKAEAEGAVDFLHAKYHRLAPFILSVPGEGKDERLVLSPAGFERYYFLKSQLAVKAFEERGVALKEVFHLTDPSGRPFFDGQGLMTAEGEAAYDLVRAGGAPRWKFDWEPAVVEAPPAREPAAKAKRSAALPPDPPEVKALLLAEYLEVSDPEITWLMTTGRCTESQLEEQYQMKSVYDKARKTRRWFFHKASIALAWIARYREEPNSAGPQGTAMFGQGGGGICD